MFSSGAHASPPVSVSDRLGVGCVCGKAIPGSAGRSKSVYVMTQHATVKEQITDELIMHYQDLDSQEGRANRPIRDASPMDRIDGCSWRFTGGEQCRYQIRLF
jgi:hypothetical protein